MRILMINSVCGIGSTGRICTDQAYSYEAEGHQVKIAYGRSEVVPQHAQRFAVRIGSKTDVLWHAIYTRICDAHGLGSVKATKEFLQWANDYDPQLLWLHNLHGYYINIEMLFNWIKSRPNMKVKWTLHDCWAFTGHCSHFDYIGCEKWKTGCHNCPQKFGYPTALLIDRSKKNYEQKKAAFCGVKDMTLITPSHWLGRLAQQGFLGEYPVEVIHNRIDRDVFKPVESTFREEHHLESSKIILGVSSIWSKRKGYDDFLKLAELLHEDEQIVLVGLTKKQIDRLPKNILGIERTHSAAELAQIYAAADVFLNLTYEDTYPTVNLEAQSCGTPVVTYDTGGSKETLCDPRSATVPKSDLLAALEQVRKLWSE